jgi:hypothetical protein
MQRALIALLRGDLAESFRLHPALIPVVVMFATLASHLVFKFKNGGRILLYMFVINTFIITVNYIYKLLFI